MKHSGHGARLLLFASAIAFADAPVNAGSVPAFTSPASPANSIEDELDKWLETVRRKRDKSPEDIFERIGTQKSEEALAALQECYGLVGKRKTLDRVCDGFKLLFEDEESEKSDLAKRAVAFLARQTRAKEDAPRRAAARGLANMGAAAYDELEKLWKKTRDDECKAYVVRGLLEEWTEGGKASDLERILVAYKPSVSGPRAGFVTAIRAFEGSAATRVCLQQLNERRYPLGRKVMVIEALAEMEGESAEATLKKVLDSEHPSLQFHAIRALDARKTQGLDKALFKLTKSEDEAVRGAALASLARRSVYAGDDGFESVMKSSRSSDSIRRQAAAAGLAELRTPAALEALYALLEDEDRSVRSKVLDAVGSMRRKDSLPILIARLGLESGTIKQDVHRVLRLLTGVDHGLSAKRWSSWWGAESAGFQLPSLADCEKLESARREEASAEGRSSARFYGLEVVSERVCFLVDVSQSMKHEVKSGGTRMEKAKSELTAALERLADGTRFNLITFAKSAIAWQDELIAMDADAREQAVDYTQRLKMVLNTAIYDALELAFEDPLVDTIYLLTDGAPYKGRIDDPQTIRSEVARWNSTRHVRIHCIAIGQDRELLRYLARDSGGVYRKVD